METRKKRFEETHLFNLAPQGCRHSSNFVEDGIRQDNIFSVLGIGAWPSDRAQLGPYHLQSWYLLRF